MKMSILITGINGFVGNYLFKKFSKNKKFIVYGLVRKKFNNDERIITLDEISKNSIFLKKNRIDCIINAAGRAHIRLGNLKRNRDKLFVDNVKFSCELSNIAKLHNINHFIHISSAKVYGETGVFNEKSKPNPKNLYAVSKLEAEKKIINVLKKTNVNISIIRPPVIYGKNSKGNFKLLTFALKFNLPLILSKKEYFRSFLSIENLFTFIEHNLKNYKQLQIFNVSDAGVLSTSNLIRYFARTYKSKSIIFKLDIWLIKILKKIPLLNKILNPLTSSFIINSINIKVILKSTKQCLKDTT